MSNITCATVTVARIDNAGEQLNLPPIVSRNQSGAQFDEDTQLEAIEICLHMWISGRPPCKFREIGMVDASGTVITLLHASNGGILLGAGACVLSVRRG